MSLTFYATLGILVGFYLFIIAILKIFDWINSAQKESLELE
jgi:hypothetical protein